MFEDPLFWILVSPGLLLGVYAQWRIKINFAKYSRVATQDGITGAEVARRLLNSHGLQKVTVVSTPGILKDHPWLFVAGVMLQLSTLAWVGIILFGSSSLFAFLTLPVEFNASTRAQELLLSQGIIKGDERIAGVQKVLGAAAWTYVTAAVSAIGFWLFFIFVLLSQARPAAVRR